MAELIVSTASGDVRGQVVDGVLEVLGVPYAAPPVGDLRWRPPARPEPWDEVLDATAFGPIAPQAGGVAGFLAPGSIQSEDCLSLNVWTPGADTARRPVLVWIHGGAFRQGASSSPLYHGATLARRGDVVVVSANYRLGALGFLAHPDLSEGDGTPAGNWGLLDQLAALEWVRDNITAFGGDPGNITLFGESAGAASVSLLLASALGRGLFHKAVVQSGAPWAVPLREGAAMAERLLEGLGVQAVGDLRDVPADDIVQAQSRLEGAAVFAFGPVIDGYLLDGPPLQQVHQGAAAGVPTIVGTNRDEWKLWAPADPRSRDLDEEGLRRRVARRLSGEVGAVETVIDTYRRARSARGEPVAPNDLWFAIESDRFFRVPALRFADALAAEEPQTWTYLFTWGSPAMRGWLGACHGLEIAFVFGTQGRNELAPFTGSGPEADRLAELMMNAWLAFAHTGDPSTDTLGEWPRHDPVHRPTLVLDIDPGIEPAPREPERSVIDRYLAGDGGRRLGAAGNSLGGSR